MSREDIEEAIEVLEDASADMLMETGDKNYYVEAIAVLRQALETEQEPVAWMHTTGTGHVYFRKKPQDKVFNPQPVYTVPPKREWVGLTDDDVIYFRSQATFCDEFDAAFMAELIEKDLKEKNHG
jgi:hypothetical protein